MLKKVMVICGSFMALESFAMNGDSLPLSVELPTDGSVTTAAVLPVRANDMQMIDLSSASAEECDDSIQSGAVSIVAQHMTREILLQERKYLEDLFQQVLASNLNS